MIIGELLGLPDNAIGPGAQGQLGLGAGYYVSNDRKRNVGMVFPKQGFIRLKNIFQSEASSLRIGRFEFQDGSEVTARNATLGVIKRDRVHQRLIGPFVFTHVMRSFDGFHYVNNKPKINYTLIGAFPTRGVLQVDGWGWMKTAFSYASVTGQVQTGKKNTGKWRLFAICYHDWRRILKQDNRAVPIRTADAGNIRIGTYGGHYVHVTETSAGAVDFLGIAAGQFGKWGTLDHRAGMVDAEAGIQPKILPRLKPWLRLGYYYGTGDRFGMLTIRPHKQLTLKSEVHALRLANHNDLWYIGGGAFQPWTFGYQSRSGAGARSLANLYDVSGDVTINAHFAYTLYYGYAQGKSVISAGYPRGKNGHLGYAELNYKF